MNSLTEIFSPFVPTPGFAAWFLGAAVKSLAILAVAGGLCVVCRRASAAARHLIWFLALAALLCVPLLSSLLPSWQKPLWSVSTRFDSGNQVSLALELAPANESALSGAIHETPALPEGTASAGQEAAFSRHIAARLSANGLAFAVMAWLGGVAGLLISIAVDYARRGRISRQSRPVQDPEWLSQLASACEALGLRRKASLRQSAESVMPLTWGWWRPVVLLPAEASDWPAERRRVVLLHELAHVKRWDCLTQWIATIVCALYWFNPLAWLAARRMCVERERACDDLVLNGGCKASEYANHLVEIARTFRAPSVPAVAMARSSQLSGRVAAIVDASRGRRLRPATLLAVLSAVGALIFCTSVWSASETSLSQQQIDRLKAFSTAKLKQSQALAASSGETISPEFKRFFDAATKGDWRTVTNMDQGASGFNARHPQYERRKGIPMDIRLSTSYWGPVLEICLAYEHIANCDPKYTQLAVDEVINSIPPGSIYFGGTDPGRGLPTAFSKSQIDADPFYVLTQNALADDTYLTYLQNMYGERRHWLKLLAEARRSDRELQALDRDYQKSRETLTSLLSRLPKDDPQCKAAEDAVEELRKKTGERTDGLLKSVQAHADDRVRAELSNELPQRIYTPSQDDSQKAFAEYTADAGQRLEQHQLKSNENVSKDQNGKIQVSGQVAVMSINALLAKMVFDKNPDHEFYVEESFPLEWMYPHLEPHGMIMKINREPLAKLSEDVLRKDHEYWQRQVDGMIGDWLRDETSVKTVCDFAERTYLRKDLSGFTGDPRFVRDNYGPKMFSKWRSSISGIYAWRLGAASEIVTPPSYLPANEADRQRLMREADFACRQAFAMCPYSPEAVFRYVNFLGNQKRTSDALLVAETASHLNPREGAIRSLVQQLRASQPHN